MSALWEVPHLLRLLRDWRVEPWKRIGPKPCTTQVRPKRTRMPTSAYMRPAKTGKIDREQNPNANAADTCAGMDMHRKRRSNRLEDGVAKEDA